MLEALGIAALVLGVLSTVFLVALVVRRFALRREELRREALDRRLRPLALALVDGNEVDGEELSAEERALLAETIGRLSRSLAGEARVRIGAFFSGTEAFAAEVRALRDRRAWRRATAAYRLGDMACSDAAPALMRRLADRDADVRAAAARSLGRLGAGDAAGPLVEALVQGTVPRAIAFRAVLDVGPAALPGVRRAARDEDPTIRAAAIELLGWIGDAADDQLLIGAVDDPSSEVRARAAGALGRLASADGADALAGALDDRIYYVRLHAARALGTVGQQSAVPRLLQQACEDRFEAARAAADAVAQIDPAALLAAAAQPDAGPHLHEAADLLRV